MNLWRVHRSGLPFARLCISFHLIRYASDKANIPFDERQNLHYDPAYDKFNGRLKISDYLHRGCQKSVPLFEGFFSTTPCISLPYFGQYFLKSGLEVVYNTESALWKIWNSFEEG